MSHSGQLGLAMPTTLRRGSASGAAAMPAASAAASSPVSAYVRQTNGLLMGPPAESLSRWPKCGAFANTVNARDTALASVGAPATKSAVGIGPMPCKGVACGWPRRPRPAAARALASAAAPRSRSLLHGLRCKPTPDYLQKRASISSPDLCDNRYDGPVGGG
jgi:hypothetical protein